MSIITDPGALALAAEALTAEAARRRRAAERFAGEVRTARADGSLKDARPQALKVLELLGQADQLEQLAEALPLLGDQSPGADSAAPPPARQDVPVLPGLETEQLEDELSIEDRSDEALLAQARAYLGIGLDADDDPILAGL